MMKYGLLVLVVLLLAAFALAQTKSNAPTAAGPTKVTGDGTKTPSGLQYWEIKAGTGRMADKGNTVHVHYTGWLTKERSSTAPSEANPSIPDRAHQVIAGWEEGVMGMKSRRQAPATHPPQSRLRKEGIPARSRRTRTLVFVLNCCAWSKVKTFTTEGTERHGGN